MDTSVRIYATAYRSVTLPCDAELCWQSVSPPGSIASWGCSIVDRVDIDDADPRVRLVVLRPAAPGQFVALRERLVKAERTPAGEKSTVVYESIDTGPASPFPVEPAALVEMQTSLSVSRITTLTSPLGRCFVELRATFVVCTPEDAQRMRAFLEESYFDPLLMCLCEMVVPSAPFRDSMFAAVMAQFEKTMVELGAAADKIKLQHYSSSSSSSPARKKPQGSAESGGGSPTSASAASAASPVKHGPSGCAPAPAPAAAAGSDCGSAEEPIYVPHFAAAAVSSCQEIYSAWLETARELRRLEKRLEVDAQDKERRKYAAGAHSEQPGNAATEGAGGVRTAPFAYEAAARRPMMQEHIGLNVNGVFGHRFELSTPGTYIASAPVAARLAETIDALPPSQLSAAGLSPAQELQMRRSAPHHPPPPPPNRWMQDTFDDGADEIIAEDAGNVFDGRGELMQHVPPPPPRRVLGGR